MLGPCRLPYTLIKDNGHSKETLDNGYLLSTRDVCGLDFIPALIKAGVKCFKIEGRMKPPEYVAIVTKIYRKYIDLALSNKPYVVEYSDKKILMQVFNRGGFSSGHLENEYNADLVYSKKPNNMGLYLGKVQKFNPDKGHITLSSKETLSIGDSIGLENETGTYTISELMLGNSNIEESSPFQPVTIGRMKGNISVGDKIYKMSNKELNRIALESLNKELKKVNFYCMIKIKQGMPITMTISSTSDDHENIYSNIFFTISSEIKPIPAINAPITEERIISQITKTKNTPFLFEHIEIDLDDNVFIPSIGCLNELRRTAIEKIETVAKNRFSRELHTDLPSISFENKNSKKKNKKLVSVLFNNFNRYLDYSLMEKVDRIYIPYRFFIDNNYFDVIKSISKKFDTYIYMPTISKNFAKYNFDKILSDFSKLKGFVISNISHIQLLQKYSQKYEFIANYTMNIFNNLTLSELKNIGITSYTISPELSKESINGLSSDFNKELIVYGKTPVMNLNYCLLGKSNKCYFKCTKHCNDYSNFYLKDRLGLDFKLQVENGITTIYNSKITSIESNDLEVDSIRIDFLDESLSEMNNIIQVHKTGNKLEGSEFTNGNLNREV